MTSRKPFSFHVFLNVSSAPKRKAVGSNPAGDVKQKVTLYGWPFGLHGMGDSNAP